MSRAVVALKKSHPSEGWVPGSYAADESARIEVANLRARLAELEAELAKRSLDDSSLNTANIAGGSDLYNPTVYFSSQGQQPRWETVWTTWDHILKYVGPSLLPECSEEDFVERLKLCFFHVLQEQFQESVNYASVIVPHVVVDQIKIQLRALGQMVPGTKRRAVSDRKTYWRLTPGGETRLLTIQALKPPPTNNETGGETLETVASAAPRTQSSDPDEDGGRA